MDKYYCIQKISFAEDDAENTTLYYRASDSLHVNRYVELQKGQRISFDTYYNGFSCGKWKKYTELSAVELHLCAEGSFCIELVHCYQKDRKLVKDCLQSVTCNLSVSERECAIQFLLPDNGIVYPIITGLAAMGSIFSVEYCTRMRPVRYPKLACNICTFHREEEVQANLRKLKKNCLEHTSSVLFDHMSVYVVDNGKSFNIGTDAHPSIHYFSNKNIGGTGGFTRGLVEILDDCKEHGHTHIVFMDDDAEIVITSLERMWSFLAYLKSEYENYTICGALMRRELPYIQAEAGARWRQGKIASHHANIDMCQEENLVLNELEDGEIDYSGWWLSCVPIQRVKEIGLPLPLFLHRDDVEYGLRMQQQFITLNGISIRHETYDTKMPQATEYYDVRNLAIVEAIHNPKFDSKMYRNVVGKWIIGNLLRYRYKYVKLNLKGMEDFLKGAEWLQGQNMTVLHGTLVEGLYEMHKESPLPEAVCYQSVCRGKKHSVLERINLVISFFLGRKKDGVGVLPPWQSVYDYASLRAVTVKDFYGNAFCVSRDMKQKRELLKVTRKALRRMSDKFESAKQSYGFLFSELTSRQSWERYWNDEE